MRLSRRDMFHAIAQIVAQRGTCTRAKHGAVIVQDGRIVSMGYNGAPANMPHCTDVGCEIGPEGGCIRTIHAEANAIAYAAKAGISCENADLYVTGEPCLRCAQLIINAGINHVDIFGFPGEYRDQRGIELLRASNRVIVIYRGRPETLVKVEYVD